MGDILKKSTRFAVHLLASHQVAQSIAFSSPKTQSNFTDFPHYFQDKLPILQGCSSVLICDTHSIVKVGDHDVWYGKIVDVLPDGIKKVNGTLEHSKPLLYYQSAYKTIGDEVFLEKFENTSLSIRDWTHRSHVRLAFLYWRRRPVVGDPYENVKAGILNYNEANKHLITHPFNETITKFFYHLVDMALQSYKTDSDDLLDFLESFPELDSFDTIFKFYSKERLYSEEAIRAACPPDLRPLPTSIAELRSN